MSARVPKFGTFEGTTWNKELSKSSGHLLHTPPSIAFDLQDVGAAQRRGVETLEVYERDEGILYSASMADLMSKGIEIDRGHGEQLALLLTDWVTDEDQTAGSPESPPRDDPGDSGHTEPVQLALFEVLP